jgi:hypothetical protein
MCMAIPKFSQKLPRVVLGDKLVVYKVFIEIEDEVTKAVYLKTPHRSFQYTIGKLQTSRITKKPNNEVNIWYTRDYDGEVVMEGLHAFVNLEDAIDEAKSRQSKADNDYYTSSRIYKHRVSMFGHTRGHTHPKREVIKVYACHVPRFARYYRGYWENQWPTLIDNIVASKLIVVGRADIPEKSNG